MSREPKRKEGDVTSRLRRIKRPGREHRYIIYTYHPREAAAFYLAGRFVVVCNTVRAHGRVRKNWVGLMLIAEGGYVFWRGNFDHGLAVSLAVTNELKYRGTDCKVISTKVSKENALEKVSFQHVILLKLHLSLPTTL